MDVHLLSANRAGMARLHFRLELMTSATLILQVSTWQRAAIKATVIVLVVCAFGTNVAAEPPSNYRSRNFNLHTDLPAADAEQLLEKLETMLTIVSTYWAAPSRATIECFVVDDIQNWSSSVLPVQARSAVQRGGITVAQGIRNSRSLRMTAKVFASSKFGTAQHEAVHAYCYQTFGRTGPTWYAEGMAELGNYWKAGDSTVTAPDYVIQFLKRSKRKSLEEITDTQQQTGDGWQNYAWRWALCHFLVSNPNYRDRFRILGTNLLAGRGGSFERTFGSQMDELNFEFQQFVDHLNPGLSVEACAWNWKASYREANEKRPVLAKVFANRGWQPSGLLVKKGQRYSVGCSGTWKTSPASEVTADGDSAGTGQLMAAIFSDRKLGPNLKLGESTSFVASKDGQLVLRCRDEWHLLDDNSSFVSVRISTEGRTKPDQ